MKKVLDKSPIKLKDIELNHVDVGAYLLIDTESNNYQTDFLMEQISEIPETDRKKMVFVPFNNIYTMEVPKDADKYSLRIIDKDNKVYEQPEELFYTKSAIEQIHFIEIRPEHETFIPYLISNMSQLYVPEFMFSLILSTNMVEVIPVD